MKFRLYFESEAETKILEVWSDNPQTIQSCAENFTAMAEIWDPILNEWVDFENSPTIGCKYPNCMLEY